ncbi:PEP-CTERM sorting domain-containing protein [Aquincola tertiaricarbonis]|uniref:PEP-CTERM sorting domain-containing protein n=1 Tax=Aquincola tertiaricarbonis TaxID=391953 RepID=UPI000615411C|nr:PEP-CTERM sorting domain-containing protein [Aquincola tertiaricarbonis]
MNIKLLGAACALTLGSAGAMAQVGAGFQITSFSHVVSGGTLSWVDDSRFVELAVESKEAGGLGGNDVDSAMEAASLSTQVAHASAQASGTASGLLAGRVTATPSFVDAFAQPHQGEASAFSGGAFTLSQAGTVTFTVNYTLDATSPLNQPLYSYGFAELVFGAGNYDTNAIDQLTDRIDSVQEAGGSGMRNGSFTLTVAMEGPQQMGYYSFNGNAFASAVTAVPEPSEWALMLAGLGVLGGWRLRQQRRAGRQEVAA